MLLTWRHLAQLAEWTAAELYEATDWIGLNALQKLNHHGKHLPAVTARIRSGRAVFRPSKENPSVPDFPECELCGSTGRAIVPRIDEVRGTRWVGRNTFSVSCRCPLGLWFAGRVKAERCWVGLEVYEQANPNWREQINQRREEQLEEARLRAQVVPEANCIAGVIGARLNQLRREPGEEG